MENNSMTQAFSPWAINEDLFVCCLFAQLMLSLSSERRKSAVRVVHLPERNWQKQKKVVV